jgi:hypothetical protein
MDYQSIGGGWLEFVLLRIQLFKGSCEHDDAPSGRIKEKVVSPSHERLRTSKSITSSSNLPQ